MNRALKVLAGVAVTLIALAICVLLGLWLWDALTGYIRPKDPADRKDTVQVYALLVAGIVGAVGTGVGLANLYLSRRNLEHNQAALDQQRELEAQRAQDAALQDYFGEIGKMLTEKGLRQTKVNDDLRTMAESQTATVLRRVDISRKAHVVLFLERSGLIHIEDNLIPLVWANLQHVDLRGCVLSEADFEGADLSYARLKGTDLMGANLTSVDLVGADLRDAKLGYSSLNYADLTHADLSGADLTKADLSTAKGLARRQLDSAKSLKDATLPEGLQ